MWNFIKDFLDKHNKKDLNIDKKLNMAEDNRKDKDIRKEKLQKEENNISDYLEDSNDISEKEEERIKTEEDRQNKDVQKIGDFLEDDITKNTKELEKDVQISKSLREPMFTEPKEKIVIQKISYTKTWIWIIIQFVVWFFLLYISNAYLQKHEPEKKFFDSSIQFWKSSISSLINKLGWPFSDEVEKDYIDKRWKMILDLENMKVKLKHCKLAENNEKNKSWKKDVTRKIIRLKNYISDEKALTLDEFIDKYQEYLLWVHTYKTQINDYCKK